MTLDIEIPDHNDHSMTKDYDYKSRCEELEAALNETRSALDEFQSSSRDLESELERELEHMDKQYKDAQRQRERLRLESEEWKGRFQSAKNEHTQTTNAMQKEIDALREAQKLMQSRLREMEMSNDDMEQNDRYVMLLCG
jgi:chromosome segregation ATPase